MMSAIDMSTDRVMYIEDDLFWPSPFFYFSPTRWKEHKRVVEIKQTFPAG